MTPAESARARKVRQVRGAVCRSFALDDVDLPDEFFPAHLSVALVDAVFRFRPGSEEQPSAPAERYCRRFGVARRRSDPWYLPEADEQEKLEDLISHYEQLGVDAMANEVFRSRSCFPGTALGRAQQVLTVAQALRGIGIELLDDVQARRPEVLAEALGSLLGADENFVRMVLMYTGDDDLVLGDGPVRRFVAGAIAQQSVPSRQAVNLVREAAYELALSPRYLDYHIWCDSIPPALGATGCVSKKVPDSPRI